MKTKNIYMSRAILALLIIVASHSFAASQSAAIPHVGDTAYCCGYKIITSIQLHKKGYYIIKSKRINTPAVKPQQVYMLQALSNKNIKAWLASK